MNAKKLMVLAMGCTMVLQLVQVLQAACVCNEEGTDYCQGCNERRVVRPKQKYYNGENSDLDLSPIGDNCWCSKLLIEPAVVPKVYPKVRDTFEWMLALNNLFKRKMLETAINSKHTSLDRLHNRLSKLEMIESKYLPLTT